MLTALYQASSLQATMGYVVASTVLLCAIPLACLLFLRVKPARVFAPKVVIAPERWDSEDDEAELSLPAPQQVRSWFQNGGTRTVDVVATPGVVYAKHAVDTEGATESWSPLADVEAHESHLTPPVVDELGEWYPEEHTSAQPLMFWATVLEEFGVDRLLEQVMAGQSELVAA